jgi:trk system potassium uptake protein
VRDGDRLVNDPTLMPLMGPLDIDAYINPRATTVSSILRHIRHGRVGVYSIGDAEAEMIEAQVLSTSPLAGRLMRDIDFPEGVLVGAVRRRHRQDREARGDLRIEEGDVIALFAMAKDVPEVERLLQVSIDFF